MLFTPSLGLIFWSSVIWIFLLVALKQVAWKPLLSFIERQEHSYAAAAQQAEKARKEAEGLQARAGTIIERAEAKRQEIEAAAQATCAALLQEAKLEAEQLKAHLVQEARLAIAAEEQKAAAKMKEQIAFLAIQVAQHLLQEAMGNQQLQEAYLEKTLAEIEQEKARF